MPFISLQDLKCLTFGVLLRGLAYAAISTYTVAEGGRHLLESTVVRNSQSVLMLREDAFRWKHGLAPLGTETIPVVALAEVALSAAARLRATLPIAAILSDEIFFLVLSSVANALALLLINAEAPLSAAPAAWTWLNPAMVLSCTLSPLPSAELLLLVGVAYSATHRRVWAVPLFGLLLCVHPTYAALAPAAWCLWCFSAAPEKKEGAAGPLLFNRMGAVVGGLAVCAALALRPSGLPDPPRALPRALTLTPVELLQGAVKGLSFLANPRGFFQGSSYEPSLGVLWYMDAQVFSAFRSYVAALVLAQPFLLMAPLCIKFGPTQPRVLFDVAAALVLLFKPTLTLCDLSIAIGLLSRHGVVVSRMRNLSLVLLGLLAAATLSPLMLQLWLSRGTGNANFPFFQGLALWIFASLGLVEFVKAAGSAN